MNIVKEIQKIPGILVFNKKEKDGLNVLTCQFNWVLKNDFGLVKIQESLFRDLKWKRIQDFEGAIDKSEFMFKNLNIPTTVETKIEFGYFTQDFKFSIPFNLEMPMETIPEDMKLVKEIVNNFILIKTEVNESLKEAAKPFS